MEWSAYLAALELDQLPLIGMVAFAVWAILTGRLYSRNAVEELRGDRDDWKQAYRSEAKANRILLNQNSELMRGLKTTEKVVSALPEVGGSP